MSERVSFEIKRKSPPAPPFSSLHQSQLYPLFPLLSFIITARDFIPTLEAAGRPARRAREKEEEGGGRRGKRRERDGEHTIDFWHRDYCKTPRAGGGGRIPRRKKKVSSPPAVVPISSRKRKRTRRRQKFSIFDASRNFYPGRIHDTWTCDHG